jgi:SulP family sulfate permease
MGGLVAALIALPYGLALAALMGLPPILGVYTSILTAPVLAFMGRNPVLIGGVSSVTVPFIAAAFERQGLGGAAKVSIVASIFMMCFSSLKLGRHIAKTPAPVVSGFSCGIGAMMVLTQLPTVFGVQVARGGAPWMQLPRVLEKLGDAQFASLVIGVTVVLVSMAARRKYPLSPAPLLGVLAGALIAFVFGWSGNELGALPTSLPPFVGFDWSPRDVYEVLPEGLALAVVASVNLIVTSRVVDHFHAARKRAQQASADAELGAYSMANLFASVFGAPMSVGIPARSLANVRCGGTTRVSNLLHAVFLAGFLLVAKDWIEAVPVPALAGVTIWMGIALLDWSTWRRLHLMRREDAAAFAATAVGILTLNAVVAIAFGCAVHAVGRAIPRAAHAKGPLEPWSRPHERRP